MDNSQHEGQTSEFRQRFVELSSAIGNSILVRLGADLRMISQEELLSIKILSGQIELLLPVIAGIKPASFLDTPGIEDLIGDLRKLALKVGLEIANYPQRYSSIDELKNELIKKCADIGIDFDPQKNPVDKLYNNMPKWVFYNPTAVSSKVKENKDIFDKIHVNASMSPEEIINKIFQAAVFSSNESDEFVANTTCAEGIILGFDKKSVIEFSNNEHDECSEEIFDNLWGVQFIISNPEAPEMAKLRNAYAQLTSEVECLSKGDLMPSAILSKLKNKFLPGNF